MRIGAIVLAAGLGTRMRSIRPKVLHPLAGRPMLSWVLAALDGVRPAHMVAVVGAGAEEVRATLPEGVDATVQEHQLGTGHATQVGLAALEPGCDAVLVLCGDTPLLQPSLIDRLVAEHTRLGPAATLVSAVLGEAGSYGRVVRGADGRLERIVEARDASAEQLALCEVNAGVYLFGRAALEAALARVDTANVQGELYLPDALPLLGGPVEVLVSFDADVIHGVNTRVDLAECEAVLQDRLRRELMLGGVTMPDPARVYVDVGVAVGRDTTLWPGVHLRGATTVGEGCEIGPDVVIRDSRVGDGASIVSAHLVGAEVAGGCQVGPFAYLRPGAVLEEKAKAGTYVELKNTRLGPGAKVPHLSYVGDAEIGAGTNIGAGNITANYDGFRKHRTWIGAGVRTGSDCVFVAPVRVGDGAMTGAGSIITHDVPDGALGIGRARQSVIEGFTARAEAKAAAAKAAAEDADGER